MKLEEICDESQPSISINNFRETAIIHLTEGLNLCFKPCVHTLTDNEESISGH